MNNTLPVLIKNILKSIKKSIIKTIGLIAFKICLIEIFDNPATNKTNTPMIPYPINPASKKIAIKKISRAPIFNRGSN